MTFWPTTLSQFFIEKSSKIVIDAVWPAEPPRVTPMSIAVLWVKLFPSKVQNSQISALFDLIKQINPIFHGCQSKFSILCAPSLGGLMTAIGVQWHTKWGANCSHTNLRPAPPNFCGENCHWRGPMTEDMIGIWYSLTSCISSYHSRVHS